MQVLNCQTDPRLCGLTQGLGGRGSTSETLKSYESDLKCTLQNETQAQYTHGTLRKGGSKKKGGFKKRGFKKRRILGDCAYKVKHQPHVAQHKSLIHMHVC